MQSRLQPRSGDDPNPPPLLAELCDLKELVQTSWGREKGIWEDGTQGMPTHDNFTGFPHGKDSVLRIPCQYTKLDAYVQNGGNIAACLVEKVASIKVLQCRFKKVVDGDVHISIQTYKGSLLQSLLLVGRK